MSTVETLHQVVDNLPEEARLDLLRYIGLKYDSFLPPITDEELKDTEALVNQLVVNRYERFKQHPETAISAEESSRTLREKYDWK